MQLEIGTEIIRSYKRLSYSPWHALAEFVDNSIQSFLNNRPALEDSYGKSGTGLTVDIRYERANGGRLTIRDNAMGMSEAELSNALYIGKKPEIDSGLSEFGMGLKTAACWFGDQWAVRTKKLGDATAHTVHFDVEQVAGGDLELRHETSPEPANEHYTEIIITHLNQHYYGRSIQRIKLFLGSMYRTYTGNGLLRLLYNGEPLSWVSPIEGNNVHISNAKPSLEHFAFQLGRREVLGWVAVMERGSRANAGLTIIRRGRVLVGWPDSWRPQSIFGQFEGSNDLVNQRLVGEINLDTFSVSHTKDEILFEGDDEELLERELFRIAEPYIEIAQSYRKRGVRRDPPGRSVVTSAIGMLEDELHSQRFQSVLTANGDIPRAMYEAFANPMIRAVTGTEPRGTYTLGGLILNIFVSDELSDRDPYLGIAIESDDTLNVVINMSHPHVGDLRGRIAVLNYLKECTFEGIAQWKVAKTWHADDPSLIRAIKDSLLRIGRSLNDS